MKHDITIRIATENGTGSSTANSLFAKALMREGAKVSSKNLFPSNIAGLPTEFRIKVKSEDKVDIYVGFNKKTLEKDLSDLTSASLVLVNSDLKPSALKEGSFELACRSLTKELHNSVTTRKLLYNMLYVGALVKIVGSDLDNLKETSRSVFRGLKEELLEANLKALELGYNQIDKSICKASLLPGHKVSYSYDGNSCAALGFLDGGAQVVTWYPITPSSSVAENFERFNKTLSPKPESRSVLQCEDEISSAVAALGAGWSGARAFTATSGPGLSLMQEALGLAYFTEVPFVLLDVQRAGPATGLPTRTAQGDLINAFHSSHGDTLHPVLLPADPQQMYDDAFTSLNLAQNIQSPVLILSDLDLGMNDWQCFEPLKQKKQELHPGEVKILAEESYKRYNNSKNIAPRSLPRISDPSLAFFTRGSGHNEDGSYSEDPNVYSKKLTRLKNKVLESKQELSDYYPKDIIHKKEGASYSLIYWGTTSQIIADLIEDLPYKFSLYQLRSLPLSQEVYDFMTDHSINFVLEQNRDGQLHKIIRAFNTGAPCKSRSLCQFNGQPAHPDFFSDLIKKELLNEQP